MRDDPELFAGSEEQFRVTRRTALKVGGVGIAGAIVGFMPGRAAAAIRQKYALNTCASVSSTTCGHGPTFCNGDPSCTCLTVYHKIQKIGATQTMCAQGTPGSVCMGTTCTGRTCGNYISGCNGNANCACYQTPTGSACGLSSFSCYGAPTCASSSDCPSGYFCATGTCCGVKEGYCVPTCPTGKPCPIGTECDSNHFCAAPRSSCCPTPICVAKCGTGTTVSTRTTKKGKVRPARTTTVPHKPRLSKKQRLLRKQRKQNKPASI
jgi:hypothetical protein